MREGAITDSEKNSLNVLKIVIEERYAKVYKYLADAQEKGADALKKKESGIRRWKTKRV